jgi:hypothetical protein
MLALLQRVRQLESSPDLVPQARWLGGLACVTCHGNHICQAHVTKCNIGLHAPDKLGYTLLTNTLT